MSSTATVAFSATAPKGDGKSTQSAKNGSANVAGRMFSGDESFPGTGSMSQESEPKL